MLHGLEGTITIKDAYGNDIESMKLVPMIYSEVDFSEPIMLADFHPFENGDYTATIDIQEGATSLSGRKQTIYAQYNLCGMEHFAATVVGFFAFVCGVPGLIIGIIVTIGFVKHGLSRPQTNATETSDA